MSSDWQSDAYAASSVPSSLQVAVEKDAQTEPSRPKLLKIEASSRPLYAFRMPWQQLAALSHIEQLAAPPVDDELFPDVPAPAVPVLLGVPPPPPPQATTAKHPATQNAEQNTDVTRDSMRMVTSPMVDRVAVL
jgi:hypothetical protein